MWLQSRCSQSRTGYHIGQRLDRRFSTSSAPIEHDQFGDSPVEQSRSNRSSRTSRAQDHYSAFTQIPHT